MPTQLLPFLITTTFAVALLAQAPHPSALAQKANDLAHQIGELADVDAPSAEQKRTLAAARKELAEFVAKVTTTAGLAAEHFVEAGSPLLGPCPAEALAISEAGVKAFPQSRFLLDHVGTAHLGLAMARRPGAARVDGLRRAEQAFRQALQLPPDTFHAHAGLFQCLDFLGEVQEALRELRHVLADADGQRAIPTPWVHVTSLLLRAGTPREALATLEAAKTDDDADPLWRPILLLRAHAIAKDVPATEAAAKALRELEDSPRTQLEVADALFFIGRKSDAQKVLARLPAIGKWESDEERVGQLFAQSGAALAAYWQTNDITAKGPLRAGLTKALDHKFVVMDPTAKPKPKESDLSASPRAMAYLVTQAMQSDEGQKDWANRVLLVLSVQASADYKPPAFEAGLLAALEKDRVVADDIPGIVLDARYMIGDPKASGVLTGLHALERITLAPKPPAGK